MVIGNDGWLCAMGKVHVLIFWFPMYLMSPLFQIHSGSDVVLDM